MSEEFDNNQEEVENGALEGVDNENDEVVDTDGDEVLQHSNFNVGNANDEDSSYHLTGMFRNWFLDYASYVNLERAIPHISDGLKPVQRRVLHAMRQADDGRYNKVANLVGQTMQYHPHGDASIKDAMVNLGQKNLLIDCQGNWGNILTGDDAAAARYIEARLTKFALETVFNPKTTQWKWSYDGRNREPICLPVKFPLLLAQGTEGIGLGMNSRILPHNFNELCDASISVLRDEPFELYPDFHTGGMIDVSRYADGGRGGKLVMRSHIEKIDNKTLKIVDIPYGVTTNALMESIVKACDAGKLSIKKIEDNTSANVEIRLLLEAKTSSDKTIDALYAFTKCQVNYSPNCCVVDNNKPCFITVSEVLRRNTQSTLNLLQQELLIERGELNEQLHFASLEKIFIQERIYKDSQFEKAASVDAALDHIDKRLEPFKKDFVREVTRDDLKKLLEIKMARILKFNSDKCDNLIAELLKRLDEIKYHLEHIVEYTIDWFKHLKKKYGEGYPRHTELRNFETIQATKVVEANEKLYYNSTDGFMGIGLKRDENNQFVCNCSDIDDIIIFYKDGKYKVIRVAEKVYIGKNVEHIAVFVKNDKRTIYNVVYRHGKFTDYYIKRFAVNGVTRDKEYDLTQGEPGSKLLYFSATPNGEDETIRVILKATTRRVKNLSFEKNFSEYAIKGRQSKGNRLTKFEVSKIQLKHRGTSTLGGSDIYYDPDVLRLNGDKRGVYLGNFDGDDQILVVTRNGEYYTTNYDLNNHFDDNILRIEKFNADKVWSVVLHDDQGQYYLKRFKFESSARPVSYLLIVDQIGTQVLITDTVYPRLNVVFGGDDAHREPVEIDAESFIAEKSFRAKGKRISDRIVARVEELEPVRCPDPEETEPVEGEVSVVDGVEIVSMDTTDGSVANIEENGQISLNLTEDEE